MSCCRWGFRRWKTGGQHDTVSNVKALSLLTSVCCALIEAAASGRPIVLLICVDGLKPLLGCCGDRRIHSPSIDRLAKRGVLFDRVYRNQAVCAPSSNALMTGQPDPAEAEKRFVRFDANKDGTLSRDEFISKRKVP